MRAVLRSFPVALIFLPLLLLTESNAQDSVAKDPQALVVLARMTSSTGWSSLRRDQDVIAVGTLERSQMASNETISITLKAMGPSRFRSDTGDGVSVIINGPVGALITSRNRMILPAHSAVSMRPVFLPFLTDLVASSEPRVSIRFLGAELVDGTDSFKIEIERIPSGENRLDEIGYRDSKITVWVSQAAMVPIKLEFWRTSLDNPDSKLPCEIRLSDYRRVGSVMLPFQFEESARGQIIYRLQLTEVRFNTGLTDADFSLPADIN